MNAAGSEDEEDESKSKKKRKTEARLKIAELKQACARPDVVEIWDVTAQDPKLLVYLKARLTPLYTATTVPLLCTVFVDSRSCRTVQPR